MKYYQVWKNLLKADWMGAKTKDDAFGIYMPHARPRMDSAAAQGLAKYMQNPSYQ